MKKIILASLFFVCSLGLVYGQELARPVQSVAKVDGLELPPDQTVSFDEGFVTVKAKCAGEVKWLIISPTRVKYVPIPDNEIILSIPPQKGTNITVFAVGLVNGKLTEFARTNILVDGGPPVPVPPGPNPPGPVPPPPLPTKGIHVTFLSDFDNMTPELAIVLNSQNINNFIKSKDGFQRNYDFKNPTVAQKKLDQVVARVGGSSVLVLQDNSGVVLLAQPIPRTEADVLAVLRTYLGN